MNLCTVGLIKHPVFPFHLCIHLLANFTPWSLFSLKTTHLRDRRNDDKTYLESTKTFIPFPLKNCFYRISAVIVDMFNDKTIVCSKRYLKKNMFFNGNKTKDLKKLHQIFFMISFIDSHLKKNNFKHNIIQMSSATIYAQTQISVNLHYFYEG